MMLLLIHGIGCIQGGEKKEGTGIIGLQKLDTDNELDIVNWTVDGTFGGPKGGQKLDSIDWELKDDLGKAVWSGIAVKYAQTPAVAGVYYIDANRNGLVDAGDTFCVKAPEDGHFTLRWYIGEGYGEYMADY